MTGHDTALEAAAKSLKDSFTASIENSAGMSFKDTGVTMPADWIWERYAVAAISVYLSTLSPDVSGLVERLKTLNPWTDLDWPERIQEAADALASLSLKLAAERKRVEVLTHTIEQLHGPLSVAALTARADTAEASLTAAQEENERLRAALRPFADQAETFDSVDGKEFIPDQFEPAIVGHTIGDLRRARAALSTPSKGKQP